MWPSAMAQPKASAIPNKVESKTERPSASTMSVRHSKRNGTCFSKPTSSAMSVRLSLIRATRVGWAKARPRSAPVDLLPPASWTRSQLTRLPYEIVSEASTRIAGGRVPFDSFFGHPSRRRLLVYIEETAAPRSSRLVTCVLHARLAIELRMRLVGL